jgi:Tfp pilus assembly protein PilE
VYKKGLVRLLNVFIFLAVLFLVYMIVYPNYRNIQRENKIADVKSNMYFLRMGIENYAAFNFGKYPLTYRDFKKYLNDENLSKNPYTLVQMTDDEIIDRVYNDPVAYEDDTPDGENGTLSGEPGSIYYATYRSPGDSTFVIHYALVGMDEKGEPIMFVDPGQKKHVFLLND